MPRFRFPLQAVLTYREHIERRKQLVVARLEMERREGESTIAAYQREIRAHKNDLKQILAPAERARPVDQRAARLQAVASLQLGFKAQRSAVSLAGTMSRLVTARNDLSSAAVDRRAIELLKERRLEAWKAEQSRREDQALDEVSSVRHARAASGVGVDGCEAGFEGSGS